MEPGVKGWLLVYCIGPLGLGTLMILSVMAETSELTGLTILLFVNLYLLYITICQKTPATRTINIWVNGLFTALIVLNGFSMGDIHGITQGLGASIWLFYWIHSDRVKITYGLRLNE